jgi:hypothetical protein
MTSTLALAASLALAGMTAQPPPHEVRWPSSMGYMDVATPDGGTSLVYGWQDLAGFHTRQCDQASHPIHLGTPLEGLWYNVCFPVVFKPDPRGAMPGDRRALPEIPVFAGPPE